MPATSQPAALASLAASCPINPRPSITIFDPGPTSASRSACSAIEATAPKAASWAGTPYGTAAHSKPGTA